jgi:integrase
MRNIRGMGSCFLKGRIWYIKYYRNGKPFRESTRSTRESDAIDLLKQRLVEISQGSFMGLEYKKVTFDDLCQDLLADYRINQKKSLWRAELSVNHLTDFFGGTKACVIDTPFIRKYVARRQSEGAKNATINRELAALRRMFRLAAQDDRIPKVPHFPMLQENNVRSGFLEHDEYQRLLIELPDYLKPILIMAYWTGCRKAEILGLIWSQVDFLNRQIVLEAGNTKNNEPRIIPMSEELCQTLLSLRPSKTRRSAAKGLVFTNRGKPIRYMYDAWRAAVKRAGLPGLLLHDCRRTAVRNFVRAGVPDKIARTISGHKTRSVFDRYNIVDERDLHDATAKLERYLAGATGPVWAQFGSSEGVSKEILTKKSSGEKPVIN